MKTKIKVNGEVREIEIKLKGKDQKEFLKVIGDLAKKMKDQEGDPERLLGESEDFLNYQDKMLSEKTGLTMEEVDDLDLEDKNKLTGEIRAVLLPLGDKGFF